MACAVASVNGASSWRSSASRAPGRGHRGARSDGRSGDPTAQPSSDAAIASRRGRSRRRRPHGPGRASPAAARARARATPPDRAARRPAATRAAGRSAAPGRRARAAGRRRPRGAARDWSGRGSPGSSRRPATVRTARSRRSVSSDGVGRQDQRPVAAGPARIALAKRSPLCSTRRTARSTTRARTAIVDLEVDPPQPGQQRLEAEDPADVGQPPAVDRLVVVADEEDAVAPGPPAAVPAGAARGRRPGPRRPAAR